VINSNLGPISHCLATIHLLQTDDRQTTPRAMDPYSITGARQQCSVHWMRQTNA